MNIPLRFQARHQRMVQEQAMFVPKPRDRAKFEIVKDGSRFSVWFHWNDEEPVLFLDRMTHLSSAVQMIHEGKRRLGSNVLFSVENPFTMDRNRKYI